jgi:hypothetical protein
MKIAYNSNTSLYQGSQITLGYYKTIVRLYTTHFPFLAALTYLPR